MSDDIQRDNELDVKGMIQKRQSELNSNNEENTTDNKPEYQHGDYVPGENGEVGGIYVDSMAELDSKVGENSPGLKTLNEYVKNQEEQIKQLQEGISIDNTNEEMEHVNRAPASSKHDFMKVEEAFSKYEIGPNGLVPAGSDEAERYKNKINALAEGKADLNDFTDEKVRHLKEAHKEEPSPSSVTTQQNTSPEPEVVNVEYDELDTDPMPIEDGNVVSFNVPSEKADTFISTLSIDERKKIATSRVIQVNKIHKKDVPVATRVINSVSEYKRIVPRTVTGENQECVLLNSGYVATFKGSGALALATILPDREGQPEDYAKKYQFCYDNLINTSIGKMSYNEFCLHTSFMDMDTMIYSILRASEPDQSSVRLSCGVPNCRNEYDATYYLSQLIDTDSITERMGERINEIVSVRNMEDKAKKVHEESPVMVTRIISVEQGDPSDPDYKKYDIEVKSPNGIFMIERNDIISRYKGIYDGIVLAISMYIPAIYTTFTMKDETEPNTYEIIDPDVILSILKEFDDETVQILVDVINDISNEEYENPTYSFKGHFKCPNCGRVEEKVPCRIEDLIFQKVERAMRSSNQG